MICNPYVIFVIGCRPERQTQGEGGWHAPGRPLPLDSGTCDEAGDETGETRMAYLAVFCNLSHIVFSIKFSFFPVDCLNHALTY